MENKQKLEQSISDLLEEIQQLDPADKSYDQCVESLTKLYKLKIESDKLESEREKADREFEANRERQRAQDKHDRITSDINIVLGFVETIVNLAVPMTFYERIAMQVLGFEETGTVTSTVGRSLFQKFFPFKF